MTSRLPKRADGAEPAAKPDNDAQRLEEVRRFCILDSGADPRFDRLTRLTSELLDMPVVLVTLIDEAREWFKSTVGTEIAEIPRDLGFCGHAMLLDGNATLTVVDALQDQRFSTHPFVVDGPKLRFYAGAPLVTVNGHKLGMLCLHDVKPRPDFGAAQERILAQLAGIVMDEIDFHRIESERKLLIGELSHRVKNVLSLVQSVAQLSGRGNAAAKNFVTTFSERLSAMASAHDRLVTTDWNEAGLKDIVLGVLEAHQNIDKTRITVDMPNLSIDPQFSQTLALLVHELVTNAIKHGALSVPAGRVTFTAVRVGQKGVEFSWTELGGPKASAPSGTGFGLKLLNLAVRQRNGTVTSNWETTGLVCCFSMPIATMAQRSIGEAALQSPETCVP